MSIANVIFDLGGVLLDWDADAIVAAVFTDQAAQKSVRAAVFDHPDWLALDGGTLDEEEAIQRFAQRSGQPISCMEQLMQQVRLSLVPKADSLVLLDELHARGIPLYCLSNMHTKNFAYLEETYSFWDRFEGIVISASIKMIKPEPDIFQYLLSKYDLDPAKCVFIDDHPANIEGARAVGLSAILFTSSDDCRRQLDGLLK